MYGVVCWLFSTAATAYGTAYVLVDRLCDAGYAKGPECVAVTCVIVCVRVGLRCASVEAVGYADA